MTRQTKLLKYLRKRYREDPKAMVTQEEICEAINEYRLDESPTSHNKCISIWLDIQKLNKDTDIHSAIYYKDNCCKIATKKEAKAYAEKYKIKALAQFKRYWNLLEKLKMSDQLKIETKEDLEELLKA